MNPADLFTKHLSSEERITELLKLFGCRFVSGRASSAPRLQDGPGNEPILAAQGTAENAGCVVYGKGSDNSKGSDAGRRMMEYDGYEYPAVELEELGGWVPDAFLHSAEVLPHLLPGDLREIFPQIMPAPDVEEGRGEPDDWLEQRARSEGLMGDFAGLCV